MPRNGISTEDPTDKPAVTPLSRYSCKLEEKPNLHQSALNPHAHEWRPFEKSFGPTFLEGKRSMFQDESFHCIMENHKRQNRAIQQLKEQQQQSVMALTLPQPNLEIFSGNLIGYCDFVRTFEHQVDLWRVVSPWKKRDICRLNGSSKKGTDKATTLPPHTWKD